MTTRRVVSLSDLHEIRRSDPDGRPWEPTVADRAAFRAWVVRTYGLYAWQRYSGEEWDQPEHV